MARARSVPSKVVATLDHAFDCACRSAGIRPERESELHHPLAVANVLRLSGGQLGTALDGISRVVREAAARGLSSLTLGTCANRMGVAR